MKTKKVVTRIFIVLIVVVVCAGAAFTFLYYKYHNQKTPESTLNSFIYALNNDDINGMLEYVEPTESELIKIGLKKFDDITDSKIAEKITTWLPFLSDFLEFNAFPELHPEIVDVIIDGEKSTITIKIEHDDEDTYYDVYLIQIENKWYIQYAWKSKLTEAEG